jgi:putative FmdB family regulatory protein
MPIYAFECDSCGHQFDRLQRLSDADPTECPECGASQVRRQLTAPSFRLAGAGWYETDFKKDSDKKRNLVDKPESTTASAPAKTETKVEAKAEPKAAAPAKPEPKPSVKSSD